MIKRNPQGVLAKSDEGYLSAKMLKGAGISKTDRDGNRHQLDVSKARVEMRDYNGAMESLYKTYQDAPGWLLHQRMAQGIMCDVMKRRKRTLTAEMRELASYLGVTG